MEQPQGEGSSYATYEAKRAQEWNATQADQIHWEREAAYRNQNYRHLYHQEGLIGTFQVRLLEASELQRSYWSALALGPVKLLGLSKAHGAVSSFVSFSFDPRAQNREEEFSLARENGMDSKPAAKAPPQYPCFVSPVAPQDDNPVWTNAHFDLPLYKGVLRDGQPIKLLLRVDEDSTAVENILPGVPSGGDSRLLGTGELDMTSLCTGQVLDTGEPQVGVLDTWVPIFRSGSSRQHKGNEEGDEKTLELNNPYDPIKKPPRPTDGLEASNTPTGRVRVLVSYIPHGMEPRRRDIVALEVFARQNTKTASCRPILPPRLPLHVVETSGPWLLVEYQLANRQDPNEKACLKVHRNAVFVIERKNVIDTTLNLALLPADVFMSTPLGHATGDFVKPVFVAGKQLLMPALLSSKLLWMAIRTTALASITGVSAATSAFVNEGQSSLTQDGDENTRRRAKTQKFISL